MVKILSRIRMYGVDMDYRSDCPRLTKWLDKLPFYSTKAMSSITAMVKLHTCNPAMPNKSMPVKVTRGGQVYIDDFEGTRAGIDLRFPLISWTLASVPQGNGLFPESALNNDLAADITGLKWPGIILNQYYRKKEIPITPSE